MTLADQIELACLMEATARKPGNVHPAAAFDDLCYDDFVQASKAIAEPLAAAMTCGVGAAVFNAIQQTHEVTGTNVNLGIVLLLAPLAAVPRHIPLEIGVVPILEQTSVADAEFVYSAIDLARPGGMGQVSAQDVHEHPTVTLREAMCLAADRDRIAEQYANGFQLVFSARKKYLELMSRSNDWERAIVLLHIWILSQWPDTLIARKCGREMAVEVSARAAELIALSRDGDEIPTERLGEFDAWLRADGHRRNPGTTADLVAATLFAAIRDGLIEPPTRDQVRSRVIESQQ